MSDSLQPHGRSLPGPSILGIFQARVLEWVAISFSRGSSQPRDRTWSPALQADALPSEPRGKPQDFRRRTQSSSLPPPQSGLRSNNREGTQPHPSTENWIKDLLSMALPTRARPSFTHSQSFPPGSFRKPLILRHHKAVRKNKNYNPISLQN